MSFALTIERCQPDAFINTAAYTAVDNAESDEAQAFLVNTIGVKKHSASL